MAETTAWSVVGAVHLLWLAARAYGLGLGLGWVSILDPVQVTATLEVSPASRLIAYLCLGWPREKHDTPELQRLGWQTRTIQRRIVLRR
jgi:5,6-dimethylbenzimidazole synthase